MIRRLFGKLLLRLSRRKLLLKLILWSRLLGKVCQPHLIVLSPVLSLLDHLRPTRVLRCAVVPVRPLPPFLARLLELRQLLAMNAKALVSELSLVLIDHLVLSGLLQLSERLSSWLNAFLVDHVLSFLESFHSLFKSHILCLKSCMVSNHLLSPFLL